MTQVTNTRMNNKHWQLGQVAFTQVLLEVFLCFWPTKTKTNKTKLQQNKTKTYLIGDTLQIFGIRFTTKGINNYWKFSKHNTEGKKQALTKSTGCTYTTTEKIGKWSSLKYSKFFILIVLPDSNTSSFLELPLYFSIKCINYIKFNNVEIFKSLF